MASEEGLLSSFSDDEYAQKERASDSDPKYDIPSDWAHQPRVFRSSTTASEKERRKWRHVLEAGTTPADQRGWGEIESSRACAIRATVFCGCLFLNMLLIKSWCALGLSSDSRHHCFGFHSNSA